MKSLLRVLIVEDSEADTQLLLRELERSNYQITHQRVESAEALSAALSRENWDILFCDFTMPHFSGQTALEIVRTRDRVLPFNFVSGTLGEHVAVKAIKAGANDYVMKTDLVRLVPAMERELREAAERRHAEEQRARESTDLAAKERALSNLALAKLPVLLYVYDEGGKLLQWNNNLELISGYCAEEIAGLSPLDFFPEETKQVVNEAIQCVLINGEATLEANLLTKDGRRIPFFFRSERIHSRGESVRSWYGCRHYRRASGSKY